MGKNHHYVFLISPIQACSSKIVQVETPKTNLMIETSGKQPAKDIAKDKKTPTTPETTTSDTASGDANKSTSGAMSTIISQFALLTTGVFLIQ